MSDMTATDARVHFSAALVTAEFDERATEALEDAEDVAAARVALDEDGPSS